MTSLILRTTTRFLLSLLLLFSVFLLFSGHHKPGGGFAGGLVSATAFALYAIAYDARSARRVLSVEPQTLIGAGLLLALGSSAVALFAGQPLMTGQWLSLRVSEHSEITLGTPVLFDLGVYFVVLGVTLLMLLVLAEE